MGEYAIRTRDQVEVKIGTCEQMYYLRASQRDQVRKIPNSLDPNGDERFSIRFRFPWPDEDENLPGEFGDYGRTLAIPGATCPDGVEHGTVQFSAHAGYLVSLPCPETHPSTPGLWTISNGLRIARNGFSGAVALHSQKMLRDGRIVPVCCCGGCGTLYRVEEPADIEALAVALRSAGDRPAGASTFFHEIASRMLRDAGLELEAGAA